MSAEPPSPSDVPSVGDRRPEPAIPHQGSDQIETPVTQMADPVFPHGDPDQIAAAEELEAELRETRPTAIRALLFGTVLLRIGTYGSSLVIPFVLPNLHERTRALLVGFLGGTQALSEMVFAPFLARWADRIGRSRILVGAPLVGLVAVICAGFSPNPAGLFVARFLDGVAAAAFVPTALGTIAAATSHDRRARASASGAFEAATLLGIAGGFGLGGYFHATFGRGAFIFLGLCYLAAATVCLLLVPRVPPLPVSSLGTIMRAITGPGPIRNFLPAWMGTFALLGAFASNLPSLLRRIPGGGGTVSDQRLVHTLDEKLVAGVLVTWIVLLVIGIVIWTPTLRRHGSAVTMRRAAPGAWVLAIGLMVANHLPDSLVWLAAPISIIGILWIAGFGPAAVAYLAECSETFAADRSALMAFYTVTLAAGGLLGTVFGGVAVAINHADGLFLFGLAVTVFAFIGLGRVVAYERALLRDVSDGPVSDGLPAAP